MQMKKKIFNTIVNILIMLCLLTGCGNKEISVKENPEEAVVKKDVTIQVMALESAYGVEGWKKVAEAFTESTGIKVNLTVDKNIESVIEKAVESGEYPDVIHLAAGRQKGITEQFIKKNMMVDITDILGMSIPGEDEVVGNKIAGGFTDTSLTNPYNDGNLYMAPMFYSPCGLFYDVGLFEKKGWELPTTWDEMWQLGEKAKEEGIALFTYPTAGYFDSFLYALMYSAGGIDFFSDATTYKEGIWETKEGEKCFEILGKVATYTHEVTPTQANAEDFKKNQQLILDNEAIFMPNGTWIVEEMADAEREEGFAWGMMPLPAMEKDGERYSYTLFEQIWIPSGAEHVEEAKTFIAFLYSDRACEIFAQEGAVQPVLGIGKKLSDDKMELYSIYENGAGVATGNFAAFVPIQEVETYNVFFEPMNAIVEGSLTIEEWREKVSSASELMRKNLIQ